MPFAVPVAASTISNSDSQVVDVLIIAVLIIAILFLCFKYLCAWR